MRPIPRVRQGFELVTGAEVLLALSNVFLNSMAGEFLNEKAKDLTRGEHIHSGASNSRFAQDGCDGCLRHQAELRIFKTEIRQMPEIVNTIRQVCEDTFGNALRVIRTELANIPINASPRRFLVCRMGSTGSTWLATLLNSHPHVFCSHEGVFARTFPFSEVDCDQILAFIRFLAFNTTHGAYSAMGDVGSSWLGHVISLPKGAFTTGMLLRHPAKVLKTRLEVIQKDPASKPDINKDFMSCIERIWGIQTSNLDAIDQIFLQDTLIFASQVLGLDKVSVIIQIEMMNNPQYCRGILHQLTGVHYDARILDLFLNQPLNRRSSNRAVKDVLWSWSQNQRRWYELMLGDMLPYLGYTLDEEVCVPIQAA